MSRSPLVSVIISCFNSTRYLAQALESVMNQSYQNLEVILVDDCSSDDTVALIQEFMKKDNRIRLIERQERGGRPAITKNTGLQHIEGEFVCFLDHDDYYHVDKIESQVSLLLKHEDCVAAFHDVNLVNSDGSFEKRYLEKFTNEAERYLCRTDEFTYICIDRFYIFQSIHYAAIHTCSVMIAVERFGYKQLIFDTRYRVVDDTDFWIRLGLTGAMIYSDRVYSSYRIHDTNITQNKILLQEEALLLLEHNFIRVSPLMNIDEQRELKARIEFYYSDLGWLYRCNYSPLKSIRAYLNAWKWSRRVCHLIHAGKALFPARNA